MMTNVPKANMDRVCPHCQFGIHPQEIGQTLALPRPDGIAFLGTETFEREGKAAVDVRLRWTAYGTECPRCKSPIIDLERKSLYGDDNDVRLRFTAYPRNATGRRAPSEVPAAIAKDFNEAELVLDLSPAASAALSRRCLQELLHAQGYKQDDLSKAIVTAVQSKTLPSHLSEGLDCIREIGNFAAHPRKDTQTGTILPVEPHEADWNLNVLLGLLDFYYVQPKKDSDLKAALNQKLLAAGKKQLS